MTIYFVGVSSAAVDQRRHVAGPNPLSMFTTLTFDAQEFNIPSKRSQAFESRSIANAGGNGDDWDSDQSSDDAGQSAFHAGTDDDDARFGQHPAMGEQTMNAGDSYVVEMLDAIAHEFGGDDRFFGNRDVAGSGGNHRNDALSVALRSRCRTIARASGRYSAFGTCAATASYCSSVARVASTLPSCSASRAKISATCAGVLPWLKITSGMPWRRAR